MSGARLRLLDGIALVLLVAGGVGWGLVGVFGLDLVASAAQESSGFARAVCGLVGLAALYGVYLLTTLRR